MNTLNKTKSILKKFNIKANKRFGQNFLVDDNILDNITNVSNITKNDFVIEIGPGLGNLTNYILENAGYVVAKTGEATDTENTIIIDRKNTEHENIKEELKILADTTYVYSGEETDVDFTIVLGMA